MAPASFATPSRTRNCWGYPTCRKFTRVVVEDKPEAGGKGGAGEGDGLVLRLVSHGAPEEPNASIRPAEEIDLVACEIEPSQCQRGDGLHRIDRK
jgi:hypothetical protein